MAGALASLLPWDALFAAGFAYSGYRTLGRWFKYTDDAAKAVTDTGYCEGFNELLQEMVSVGDRAKPTPGAGAEASGQGHLWRDWGNMKTKQRLALLNEMRKVLEWSGQDEAFKVLKKHKGTPWARLPDAARKALLIAADRLDWSFLDGMAMDGAALAKASCLWQVNEPLPALSAEPALAEALLEEASGLQALLRSADLAVQELLAGQQQAVISGLAPAQRLQVVEARRKVDQLREAAQGGLGLGSGGKAARGQQLLELLRGIALTPAGAAERDAKAAASAALDTAADDAVAPLREQHTAALATALDAARTQALGGALAARIRPSPSRPQLDAPTTAALVGVAADEVGAALAALSAPTEPSSSPPGAPGTTPGLAARRAAAERLMGMASLIDTAAAAAAAALVGASEADQIDDALAVLSEAAERLQNAAIRAVEAKLKAAAAAGAAPATANKAEAAAAAEGASGDNAEDDAGEPSAGEATPAVSPEDSAAAAAADAVAAALQDTKAAAAALLAAAPDGAGTGGDDDVPSPPQPSADEVAAAVRKEVLAEAAEKVAAVEERMRQQQDAALSNAKSRERMAALLEKAKLLMSPSSAPKPADDGADTDGVDISVSTQLPPAEAISITEEFMRQLGARPLASALSDLNKLLQGAAAPAAGARVGTAALSRGLSLEPDSDSSLTRLGELLDEIELADGVMTLELGPGLSTAVARLAQYCDRVRARHAAAAARRDSGGEADAAADSAVAATPKSLGVSPNEVKEAEALQRCATLGAELCADGLTALGLSVAQYRQLAALREAVAALDPGMDALKYDRCVTSLRDVAAQLGPIGAAIQTKIASTEDEALRALMTEQKTLAVDLYGRLQAFLEFENDIRGPLKSCLRELNSLAGGIGAPRTPNACSASTLKLEMAGEESDKLQALLQALASSAGGAAGSASTVTAPSGEAISAATSIVETLQGAIEAMQGSLGSLCAHVALRTRALDPEAAMTAAAAALGGGDLDLNTLEGMEPELDHPLTVLAATAEETQAEWEAVGFEAVARGRVASVLIAMATTDAAHTHPAAGKPSGANGGDGSLPRAAVPIPGLPSGKSPLQLAAERILRVQRLAAAATFGAHAPVTRTVQWAIMTSPATHDKLAALLQEKAYFGLQSRQVTLFCCHAAPPVFAGEPLRALTLGSSSLTRGAPGSGELFAALSSSGALRALRRAGVRHVEVNAVDDNALARPADPLLIGFAVCSGLDAVAKVVEPAAVAGAYAAASASAADGGGSRSGGGAGAADGAPMPGGPGEQLDEATSFLAPCIGSYYFSMGCLSRLSHFYASHPLAGYRLVPMAGLPSKAAPAPLAPPMLPPNATQAQRMQAHQAMVAAQQAAAAAPARPVDGFVPTRCISDVFAALPAGGSDNTTQDAAPLSGAAVAYLGVEREEEFSCVLGGGPHLAVPEPELAAGELLALTTSWVEAGGGVVECEEGVEVSPLVSYAGEGLEVLAGEGTTFSEPYDLTLQGATGDGVPRHNLGRWAVPGALMYAAGAAVAVSKQLAAARNGSAGGSTA